MSTQEDALLDDLIKRKQSRPATDVFGGFNSWYKGTFGTDPPVKNLGASEFERKAGWEHSRSFDLGVHPGTPNGKRVIEYLTSQGIPYSAFTGAVNKGGRTVSTGSHIHIGPPSKPVGTATAEDDFLDRLIASKTGSTPQSRRGAYMKRAVEARKSPDTGLQNLDKLARDIEWHFGYSTLAALPSLSPDKQQQIVQMATEFAAADEAKKKTGVLIPESPAWKLKNQRAVGIEEGKDFEARTRPEVDEAQRAAYKAGANPFLHMSKPVRATLETLALAGAGLMEFGSGIGKMAEKVMVPGAMRRQQETKPDFLERQATQTRKMSAEAEGVKPLGAGTRFVQELGSGIIETAPLALIPGMAVELLLAKIAVGAATFGGFSGVQEVGRGSGAKDVAKSAAAGGALGALFGVPLPGKTTLQKMLSGIVVMEGGGTAINMATGQPLDDAMLHALPLLVLRGGPGLLRSLKVKTKTGEVRPATVSDLEGIRQSVPEATQAKLRGAETTKFDAELAAGTKRLTEQRNLELPKVSRETSPTLIESTTSNLRAEQVDTLPSQFTHAPATKSEGTKWFVYRDTTGSIVGRGSLNGNQITGLEVLFQYRSHGYGRRILTNLISKGGREAVAGSAEAHDLYSKVGQKIGGNRFQFTDPVEMRHAGLDPREAIKRADNLERPGFTIDRGRGSDFTTLDKFRTPLSGLDFKGFIERIGGPTGKAASEAIRTAQVNIDEQVFKWERKIGEIDAQLGQGGIKGKDGYREFVNLVEKDFKDLSRTHTNPNVVEALKLHDELTETWRQHIIKARQSLGIEMPADWGVTERGYFRHLFLGDIQMFKDSSFIGTARTYAEAQKMAADILKTEPNANVHAKARQNFTGDSTVRLSTRKFWRTVNELTKSAKESAEVAAGHDVTLTKADILEDIRGTVGMNRSKMKPFGSLLKREGYEGFSTNYPRVMEAHAGQMARTQELSKLNRELVPLVEKLKAEGKPGLAEEVSAHLNDLWGVPRPSEKAFGSLIRNTPILRNYVSSPDFAFRSIARKLTEIQTFLKLDFNLRASAVNALDPLTTLWPYVTSKEFASLYRDYSKPATRRMLRDLGVLRGSSKFSEGAIEHRKPGFRERLDDVRDAEGLGQKVRALKELPPRPFRAASDLNRGIGYLYGVREATRLGLHGNEWHRHGLEWARKVEFDNSVWNAAPILRTPAGRILGQFKGYPLKSLENLRTLMREKPGDRIVNGINLTRTNRLAKFAGSKVAVGGMKALTTPSRWILGLGGYEIVVALSDQFQQYGMSKDDADRYAQSVYYGAPALIGQDLSSSVAVIDDLYGNTPKEKLVNLVGGPSVGTVFSVYEAPTAEKRAAAISPYARGVTTVIEMAKEGNASVSVGHGNRLELSKFESVMRVLGFTPVKQSAFFDEQDLTTKERTPLREATREKKELKDGLEERLRKGDQSAAAEGWKLVGEQKLTRDEMNELLSRARLTPLQETFKNLPLVEAERRYLKMSPEVKKEVELILIEKRRNANKWPTR